ncbi:MAG: hydrogenase subunit MbhD domain-containing protein [Trueperaceae bacterium]
MSDLFDIVMLALLIATAVTVARARDLLAAVVIFSMYSLTMTLVWQHRGAPDVAMTEAAVGAGVTTVLFLITIARTTRREKP